MKIVISKEPLFYEEQNYLSEFVSNCLKTDVELRSFVGKLVDVLAQKKLLLANELKEALGIDGIVELKDD